MSTPSKILLVRFSALGDVVQTIPILSMLRDAFPKAKIGWAIDAELVSTIQGHPALDYIHPCHRRQWSSSFSNISKWSEGITGIKAFINEIRAVDYDVAVDAQGLFKTALVPYLARIKRRIGYAHGREFSQIFYNEKYLSFEEYFDPTVFHLEHMAVLCKAIGCNEVKHLVETPPVSEPMKQGISTLLRQELSLEQPLVSMAPGTQWISKAWPEQYWISLLDRILKETRFNVVMLGSKPDGLLVSRIIDTLPKALTTNRIINLAGQTKIPEMYALFQFIQAHIGSDSAPLHIAGATKVPHLIGIYGPTAHKRTPPIGSADIQLFSTEGSLPCQPCHKKVCPLGTTECMTKITPDEIFQALVQALNPRIQPTLVSAAHRSMPTN